MAKSKMYCLGRDINGSLCKNWALKGSYYCEDHQYQETTSDGLRNKTTQFWTTTIIIFIIILLLLISRFFGFGDKLLK
jgi:hypothetical protein